MTNGRGWISYAGGQENSHLTAEQRAIVEERLTARGRLQARVEVDVYEDGADAQVSFSNKTTLGPDAGRETIAQVVSRAREQLERWR
jgi:hypothetical protein